MAAGRPNMTAGCAPQCAAPTWNTTWEKIATTICAIQKQGTPHTSAKDGARNNAHEYARGKRSSSNGSIYFIFESPQMSQRNGRGTSCHPPPTRICLMLEVKSRTVAVEFVVLLSPYGRAGMRWRHCTARALSFALYDHGRVWHSAVTAVAAREGVKGEG